MISHKASRSAALGLTLALTVLISPSPGAWFGEGEVVGEVISSELTWGEKDSVIFRMAISEKTSKELPFEYFHYTGPLCHQVSPGDRLHLEFASNTNRGIRVTSLEFLSDEPGKPEPAPTNWKYNGFMASLAVFECGGVWGLWCCWKSWKKRGERIACLHK